MTWRTRLVDVPRYGKAALIRIRRRQSRKKHDMKAGSKPSTQIVAGEDLNDIRVAGGIQIVTSPQDD